MSTWFLHEFYVIGDPEKIELQKLKAIWIRVKLENFWQAAVQIWEVESPLLSEQANGTVPTQWSVARVILEMLCVNAALAALLFFFFFFLFGKQGQQALVAWSAVIYIYTYTWSFPTALHAASQGSPMTRLANAARDGTQVWPAVAIFRVAVLACCGVDQCWLRLFDVSFYCWWKPIGCSCSEFPPFRNSGPFGEDGSSRLQLGFLESRTTRLCCQGHGCFDVVDSERYFFKFFHYKVWLFGFVLCGLFCWLWFGTL